MAINRKVPVRRRDLRRNRRWRTPDGAKVAARSRVPASQIYIRKKAADGVQIKMLEKAKGCKMQIKIACIPSCGTKHAPGGADVAAGQRVQINFVALGFSVLRVLGFLGFLGFYGFSVLGF